MIVACHGTDHWMTQPLPNASRQPHSGNMVSDHVAATRGYLRFVLGLRQIPPTIVSFIAVLLPPLLKVARGNNEQPAKATATAKKT